MIPIKRMIFFYYLAFVEYIAGLENTTYLEENIAETNCVRKLNSDFNFLTKK